MTPEEYKEIFRKVLPRIPIPKKNRISLEEMNHNFEDDPYAGHCANATAVGWLLFGAKYNLKPYKEKDKPGNESHYWLANPQKGKEHEKCDLTVFKDTNFNYNYRYGVSWISKLKNPNKLKDDAREIYDAVIAEINNTSSP
jgi:hypothetical protein